MRLSPSLDFLCFKISYYAQFLSALSLDTAVISHASRLLSLCCEKTKHRIFAACRLVFYQLFLRFLALLQTAGLALQRHLSLFHSNKFHGIRKQYEKYNIRKGGKNNYSFLSSRRAWQCSSGRRQRLHGSGGRSRR